MVSGGLTLKNDVELPYQTNVLRRSFSWMFPWSKFNASERSQIHHKKKKTDTCK